MKFRWRGGAKGYLSRSVGRAVRRSVPDDQLGSCFAIVFLLAVLVGSPVLIPILIMVAFTIMPLMVILGLLVSTGIVTYFAIKYHYPQKFASWFFLKEDEPDGTVLSLEEIKNRLVGLFDYA